MRVIGAYVRDEATREWGDNRSAEKGRGGGRGRERDRRRWRRARGVMGEWRGWWW